MENQENIELLESLLKSTNRPNIDNLINYLRTSDFYTAPASTRYHSCYSGGLLQHSLNVYRCLVDKLNNNPTWQNVKPEDDSSLIIISLLHDLCKTNFYIEEPKNKKVYSEYGSKRDSVGRYDWEVVQGWKIDDKFPYGHGEKSVMMIEQFIDLSPVERYAIRWHMGFTEPKESWNTLGSAIKKYPIILALHEADIEATYLLEDEEG